MVWPWYTIWPEIVEVGALRLSFAQEFASKAQPASSKPVYIFGSNFIFYNFKVDDEPACTKDRLGSS
jgi:hypothetical protein